MPPAFLHAKDLGTLEANKWADLIVLDKNPLDDIKNTRTIDAVYIAGNRVAGPAPRNLQRKETADPSTSLPRISCKSLVVRSRFMRFYGKALARLKRLR